MSQTKTYNLLEVANTHAGSIDYLMNLIKEYHDVDAQGIKFQILHPDKIALPDYAWYKVYQEICFSPEQWLSIFQEASKTKEIWLDMFDEYALEILNKNKGLIKGLKFQASILFNKKLFQDLSKINLSDKTVIINISGIELNEIQQYITEVESLLKPKELILQIGFQSYPTLLKDSGLSKIKPLLNNFGKKISFTDHLDGSSADSLMIPVMAVMQGAYLIEKHIMLSGEKAKYDSASAVVKEQYLIYLENLKKYSEALNEPFANDAEKKYLSNSIQIPIVNKTIKAGRSISILDDLNFRRTNSNGIRTDEVQRLVQSRHILAKDKSENEVLLSEDFKKANIATIIACRLKSTRLPKKAIEKIGDYPSVELCIKNCLRFNNINHTILATSTTEEDAELSKYTFAPQVIFHKGDPEDVMKRYLDIIDKLNIDVFVRVTADMPYVSNDILQILLKSHFETGADYTNARAAAVGTNLEIINASALRYAKSFFPNANYSEYMTWYFQNNPEHFKLNIIDLPKELVRDYRLTLDHLEDLQMFNKIEAYFKEKNLDFSIQELFKYLDTNPEVTAINGNIGLVYKTNQELIDTLNKVTKIHFKK